MKDLAFVLRRSATILAVVMLTLTLMATTTGILLSFYYEPEAGDAYTSLRTVMTEVNYGWLFRTVHDLAGNWVIGVGLVQIVVMFLGERWRRSWLSAWISGILFVLAAIGLSWTAMILDWSQLGFWRLRIELGTVEAIPLIGTYLRDFLTGGPIGTFTVTRMYTLHSYVISVAAVFLAIAHLVSLVVQEREIYPEAIAAATLEPVPPLEASCTESRTESQPNSELPI